ncbi:lipid II flippase MurJ [Longispora sp. K20-0274]|uniref:murein biosynthesis integral membrane protein MurJ n=1 Tax=Longispora sp. K20-0274 TaxID=3088255 RepID=UPI00399A9601
MTTRLVDSAAVTGDSLAVAGWTAVSRASGVVRFAVVGAVLGPTYFGNTFQFTNTLPNLVYYGFLGGSLFASLLVPALVGHIDAGDRAGSARLAGGFLGTVLVALAVVAVPAVLLGPLALRADGQEHVARLLLLMFVPQLFCYGVIGTSTAVMYAHRRFPLAAAAPALENLGIIAVLAVAAVRYGTGTGVTTVGTGELLLLGLGTTGAVAGHAAVQWWGARRAGVTLVPRPGLRDPEVRALVRRAAPSVAQAGLVAGQVLVLLVLANRVPGGVVAFQLALSFYAVAIALGAEPVGLSLLPRLARVHFDGDTAGFRDALGRGLGLGLFVTAPAAMLYAVLATPLARAVSFGRMGTADGVTLVAVSLAALAVAVLGQTVFMICTYASYARGDSHSPLRATVAQVLLCVGLAGTSLLARGPTVLALLGLAYSAGAVAAGVRLGSRLLPRMPSGVRLGSSLARSVAGAVLMAGPAWLTATVVSSVVGRPLGAGVGLVAALVVGGAAYLGAEALLRSPELAAMACGLRNLRGRLARVPGGARHG